ncbi:hypothetical protein EVAR_14415_1 [Eumeta japonica]|uniref:Uncharacterized protein n=1 Tax=Eumeta variegata TaxID=151549 RepID=A0A4C1TX84_EUMVA|nr:hypothetical protein EVAR_14415_1 [Eumeta japonica]
MLLTKQIDRQRIKLSVAVAGPSSFAGDRAEEGGKRYFALNMPFNFVEERCHDLHTQPGPGEQDSRFLFLFAKQFPTRPPRVRRWPAPARAPAGRARPSANKQTNSSANCKQPTTDLYTRIGHHGHLLTVTLSLHIHRREKIPATARGLLQWNELFIFSNADTCAHAPVTAGSEGKTGAQSRPERELTAMSVSESKEGLRSQSKVQPQSEFESGTEISIKIGTNAGDESEVGIGRIENKS